MCLGPNRSNLRFLLRSFLPLLTLTLAPSSATRTCTFMSGASEGDLIATHLENAKSAILMEGKSDTYHGFVVAKTCL